MGGGALPPYPVHTAQGRSHSVFRTQHRGRGQDGVCTGQNCQTNETPVHRWAPMTGAQQSRVDTYGPCRALTRQWGFGYGARSGYWVQKSAPARPAFDFCT